MTASGARWPFHKESWRAGRLTKVSLTTWVSMQHGPNPAAWRPGVAKPRPPRGNRGSRLRGLDRRPAGLRRDEAKASAMADRVFEALVRMRFAGETERRLARRIEELAAAEGADGLFFSPIVASGPHSALPHHRPTERVVQPTPCRGMRRRDDCAPDRGGPRAFRAGFGTPIRAIGPDKTGVETTPRAP